MITVQEILGYNPCKGYSEKRLLKLWAGRESLSPKEVTELEIPYEDRVWALCRCLEARDLDALVKFAQACAARADTGLAAWVTEAASAAYWASSAADAASAAAYWAARASAEWTAERQTQLDKLVAALEAFK